jgi:acetyltransferase
LDERIKGRIDTIFMPSSIAVIGASHKEHRASYHVVKGLREGGFSGRIYPVNPALQALQGLPVYGSVMDIPGPVDLAYIAVPAQHVPGVLDECGRKGIRSAILYSSGFSESGAAGAKLEREALAVARRHGISFIGPNCIGVADSFSKNTYYSDVPLEPGVTSLVSHSGSLCGSITRMGYERGVRFARTVSLGNRADLSTCDFLEYLGEDRQTKIIAMYLESISEGTRFLRLLSGIGTTTPLLIWKAGRTGSGSQAAASHTAALASDHTILRAAFKQARIIECQGIEELLDQTVMFHCGLPVAGKRLGIVSAPGGVAVAASDACEEHGLTLAQYSPSTVERLLEVLPPFGSPKNPVDLTTQVFFDLELYSRAIDIVMADDLVDLVLVIAPAEMHPVEFANLVNTNAGRWRKPFAVSLTVPEQLYLTELRIMRRTPIPLFPTVERAVRALSSFASWHLDRRVDAASENIPDARESSYVSGSASARGIPQEARALLQGMQREGPLLDEHDAKRFLHGCGLPTAKEISAVSPEEASARALSVGFPLVLKGIISGITHKTELGLVRCGISSEAELREALVQLRERIEEHSLVGRLRSMLLQEMIEVTHELIVGVKRDATFGPVVMFGLGGTAVEVLRDVVLRIAPFSRSTAMEMIRSVRAYPLLVGFRGKEGVDLDLLADILVRVGDIAAAFPEIKELDINPLAAAKGGGFVVIDAVIRVEEVPPADARGGHADR